MNRIYLLFALIVCLALVPTNASADEVVVDVNSRGETVRILVATPRADPVAVVVLFAGGGGVLKIDEFGNIREHKNNFLIRSYSWFGFADMVTVIIDGPSDRRYDLYKFRGTKTHARDVGAVIAYLKREYGLPIWLVGTSRGTSSVANAAIRLQGADGPDGIALTASMLEYNRKGNYVLGMDLDKITVPVVIAHHKRDACGVTPPSKVKKLVAALRNAKSVDVLWYDGGQPSGRICGGRHYHGFIGQEHLVVIDIAAAIRTTLPGGS